MCNFDLILLFFFRKKKFFFQFFYEILGINMKGSDFEPGVLNYAQFWSPLFYSITTEKYFSIKQSFLLRSTYCRLFYGIHEIEFFDVFFYKSNFWSKSGTCGKIGIFVKNYKKILKIFMIESWPKIETFAGGSKIRLKFG